MKLKKDKNKETILRKSRSQTSRESEKGGPFDSLISESPAVQRLENMQQVAQEGLVQRMSNKTGMPDQLKSGIEQLSGVAMDDVKVHYNSNMPAQLNAHAYAQGNNIHLASGQEKHLGHEAWHVVQQKQGRVRPTMEMNGAQINDDKSLEREADLMGSKALQMKTTPETKQLKKK